MGLERDGFVVSSPHRGFTVAPLVVSEMAELYGLIGNLKSFALRASPVPKPEEIDQLRRLNGELGSASSLDRSLALDEQWHRQLLANSHNSKVLAVLKLQKTQLRRLEFAFTTIVSDVELSLGAHTHILDELEAGNLEGAAKSLEGHWVD